MKYIVDIDALVACLDHLEHHYCSGVRTVPLNLLKKFIESFPKDELTKEELIPRVSPSDTLKMI